MCVVLLHTYLNASRRQKVDTSSLPNAETIASKGPAALLQQQGLSRLQAPAPETDARGLIVAFGRACATVPVRTADQTISSLSIE
jgi:hypothetical protein